MIKCIWEQAIPIHSVGKLQQGDQTSLKTDSAYLIGMCSEKVKHNAKLIKKHTMLQENQSNIWKEIQGNESL
jgi:hypothetical protein